ncbi:hypothetical protein KJ359_010378 [Pestalotiopsis sp. 9143b]|nr:hypothetical protein KJ359_010378 [Pestalotiopsis sp. 9143b]
MGQYIVYKIRYARHVLSESNANDNSGVDLHDPVLTTPEREQEWIMNGKLEESKRGTGREWAEGRMREQFLQHKNRSSVFLISPLIRAIQTFLLSATEEELRQSRIIIEPRLIEQTRWFSDRPRPIRKIQEEIEKELQYRFNGGLKIDDLNITWDRMLQSETNDTDRLSQPWYLKTGEWAPEQLIERGTRAVQAILQECKNVELSTGRPYSDYEVCVFGHGGFVNYMTDKIGNVNTQVKPPRLTDWTTGEIRDYKIYENFPSLLSPCSLLVRENDQPLTGPEADAANTQRRNLKDYIANLVNYSPEQEARFGKSLIV